MMRVSFVERVRVALARFIYPRVAQTPSAGTTFDEREREFVSVTLAQIDARADEIEHRLREKRLGVISDVRSERAQ